MEKTTRKQENLVDTVVQYVYLENQRTPAAMLDNLFEAVGNQSYPKHMMVLSGLVAHQNTSEATLTKVIDMAKEIRESTHNHEIRSELITIERKAIIARLDRGLEAPMSGISVLRRQTETA